MSTTVGPEDAAFVNSDDLGVEHVFLVIDEDADAGRHLLGGSIVIENGLVADDCGILPYHFGRDFEFGLFYMNQAPKLCCRVVKTMQMLECQA